MMDMLLEGQLRGSSMENDNKMGTHRRRSPTCRGPEWSPESLKSHSLALQVRLELLCWVVSNKSMGWCIHRGRLVLPQWIDLTLMCSLNWTISPSIPLQKGYSSLLWYNTHPSRRYSKGLPIHRSGTICPSRREHSTSLLCQEQMIQSHEIEISIAKSQIN